MTCIYEDPENLFGSRKWKNINAKHSNLILTHGPIVLEDITSLLLQ